MKELSTSYAIAELVPVLRTVLEGKNIEKNAYKIYNIAQKITGTTIPVEILNTLRQEPKLITDFQNEIVDLVISNELQKKTDATICNKPKYEIIISIIIFALLGCVSSIVLCREKLSGEAITIISTVAGIFGSCLKDAFSNVFAKTKNIENSDSCKSA